MSNNYKDISNKPTALKRELTKRDAELEETKQKLEVANDTLNVKLTEHAQVVAEKNDLASQIAAVSEKIEHINDFYQKYKDIEDEIQEAHDLITVDNDEGVSLKTEIEEYRAELLDGKNSIKSVVASAFSEIQAFRAQLFGSVQKTQVVNSETGETENREDTISGMKQEIALFFENIKSTQKERLDALDELYSKYDTQISNLLPGALSAGLSAAHHDTSEFHMLEAKKSQAAFWITIGMLVICGLIFFVMPWISQIEGLSWASDPFELLVRTLPITAPLIWLAISFQLSIKRHDRMHAEYKHKENLCKTFEGLRKAAQEKDNKNLSTLLLEAVIRANAHNPSSTLDKHIPDTPIGTLISTVQETVEKVADTARKATAK